MRTTLLLTLFLPIIAFGQSIKKVSTEEDRLELGMDKGTLNIIPLTKNSLRIKWLKDGLKQDEELILINDFPVPSFQVTENDSVAILKTEKISATVNKQTGQLVFRNHKGEIFLKEIAGSRRLEDNTVQGEPCIIAEQSFYSPDDEVLHGLGQFQDGHFNLKDVSRKLIQVNSQIAIPFLYSSKGYGILWHQYGLTEFNPADHQISLEKQKVTASEEKKVEVTTTSGTQTLSQQEALYTGSFELKEAGEYSFMLDLGGMENRHYLVIDDTLRVDQSNLWLPPATSVQLSLKAGKHDVQIICKSSNTPKLSWKLLNNNTTTFRSPHAKALDYVVFHGDNADAVIGEYRNLSGNAPMLPLWAYGFWQCRERYSSSEELVNTVKEFRKRKLPVDVIVQDWQYWGDNGWGVPQLDSTRYPNPEKFIKEIHDLKAHFTISIWSNPDKNSNIGKRYVQDNLFIPDTKWLDYFNPETRQRYWQTLNKNLFEHGVDGWWMDATEPENDALVGTGTFLGPGEFYRLTYPLFVSKSVYEGQRKTNPEKRVTILTRSAFAGQQRYGTINWSGDIGGTWDSYKKQIVSGLNFSMTGMPFWTTDIGGFFRPGNAQYTDENYRELLTRWFQWGAFNTIFRIHGYQSETEPWKFGGEVENNMRKMLNLRYRLMPYIYSEAWQITSNSSTMMRPLLMDFPEDEEALHTPYQYMFGKSFLVIPVTEAGVSTQEVYLPEGNQWYDFYTGKNYKGGQTIVADAPVDQIPVFVKAGSIIPFGEAVQYSAQSNNETLEINIYPGADGKFVLYEDERDNYNYKDGAYSTIEFEWDDAEGILRIKDRKGEFSEMLEHRIFNITLVDENSPKHTKSIQYKGKKVEMKLSKHKK